MKIKVLGIQSRLDELMEFKDVKTSELCRATGLTPASVSRLLKNRFDRVDVQTLIKLCDYFELDTLDELLEVKAEKHLPDGSLWKEGDWMYFPSESPLRKNLGKYARVTTDEKIHAVTHHLGRCATFKEICRWMWEQHQKESHKEE